VRFRHVYHHVSNSPSTPTSTYIHTDAPTCVVCPKIPELDSANSHVCKHRSLPVGTTTYATCGLQGSLHNATAEAALAHHTQYSSGDDTNADGAAGDSASRDVCSSVGGDDALGDRGVQSSQTRAVRRSNDVLALRLKVSELERMVRGSFQGLQGGRVGGGGRPDSGGEGGCRGVSTDNVVNSASSSRSHLVEGRGQGGGHVAADEVSRMEERLAMLEEKHRKREQELQTLVAQARAQV
jgi:hypothetical protein